MSDSRIMRFTQNGIGAFEQCLIEQKKIDKKGRYKIRDFASEAKGLIEKTEHTFKLPRTGNYLNPI